MRSKIQEGKKGFSEAQGEVTVCIIKLCDYEKLCQKYNGKDLLDLLEKVYDGLDNFCEQFAVQKLESAGRTYIACGGLKVCESEVDPRLLGNHHSVRVSDFACSAVSFVNSITLKDGKRLKIQVGIHTGEAIVGILGDIKPQFSLIGQTLYKSVTVCRNAQPGKILISLQCYNTLKSKVNNFSLNEQVVEIDGTMHKMYTLHKRKNLKRLDKKERLLADPNQKEKAPVDMFHNPFSPLEEQKKAAERRNGGKYFAIAMGNI